MINKCKYMIQKLVKYDLKSVNYDLKNNQNIWLKTFGLGPKLLKMSIKMQKPLYFSKFLKNFVLLILKVSFSTKYVDLWPKTLIYDLRIPKKTKLNYKIL